MNLRCVNPVDRPSARREWLWAERIAWAFGLVCLATWGALHIERIWGARYELDRFDALQAAALRAPASPDLSLWSPARIAAWRSTLHRPAAPPLAVLRVPQIGLEVAVLPGTDDSTLNRAVGHIDGTALPGAEGNAGIAGHRDGFFRGLKDIGSGDIIHLDTLQRTGRYRVERVWVVSPDDISVLDETPHRSLTLVTCYPFYFVGSAPERYIVRAVRVDDM